MHGNQLVGNQIFWLAKHQSRNSWGHYLHWSIARANTISIQKPINVSTELLVDQMQLKAKDFLLSEWKQ